MKRTLVNLAAAASAVLFVAVAVLGVRSAGLEVTDTLYRRGPDTLSYAESVDGKILLSHAAYPAKPGTRWYFQSEDGSGYTPSPPPWFDIGGLSLGRVAGSRTYLTLPAWLTLPATAALPGLWAARWRRRRRAARAGSCSRCGYDLRATPGRCPECGTEAPTGT